MRRDRGREEPLSTHATIQILVRHDAPPRVAVTMVGDPDGGDASGIVFLTVEAEHRTNDFDHTATFTVSGPPVAVDRLLLAMRSAFASRVGSEV